MPNTEGTNGMTASLLSKEIQIVLLSAGGEANDAAIRALWDDDVSAMKLQFLAQWERATLVLWRRLRKIDGLLSNYAGAADLEKAARVWEFKLLHLESRLFQLADLMTTAGIPMMPLKGSGLAYTVYSAFTDRPMNDLDLLIPPDRAMEAWNLTREKKWTWDADAFPLEKYALHHHLPPLKDSSGSGVRVEIHTDLCLPNSPFNMPVADVWETSRTIDANGHSMVVPSKAYQMLYTCIHFAWMHAMEDKAWLSFLDIAAYVQHGGVDWDEFTGLAFATRADTCAYWTLRLAQSLSKIPVPSRVLLKLKPPLPESVLLRLERHYSMTMFPTDKYCPSVWLNDKLFRVGLNRGKHVVEMHEFVSPDAGTTDEAQAKAPGFWTLLKNHLVSWKRWARYARMTLIGGRP